MIVATVISAVLSLAASPSPRLLASPPAGETAPETLTGLLDPMHAVTRVMERTPPGHGTVFIVRAGPRTTASWVAAVRTVAKRVPARAAEISVRPDDPPVDPGSTVLAGRYCGEKLAPVEVLSDAVGAVERARATSHVVYVLDPALLDSRPARVNTGAAVSAVRRAARSRCVRLSVVGPEARFGGDSAFVEIPHVPWASRPYVPGVPRSGAPFDIRPKRFRSQTPRWFTPRGGEPPRNTDCPSGRGPWWLAAIVTPEAGVYAVHPDSPSDWLDHCHFSASRRATTEPVLDPTRGPGESDAWMLRQIASIRRSPHWTLDGRRTERTEPDAWSRRDVLPTDEWGGDRGVSWCTTPDGDASLARLSQDLRDAADGAGERAEQAEPGGRERANLLLFRFWLESSAFHAEAARLWGRRTRTRLARDKDSLVRMTCLVHVKLSDVLPHPEGSVVIDAASEREYSVEEGDFGEHFDDDNPLPAALLLEERSPLYRGLRRTECVLARIPAELRKQALRTFAAARRLMDEYADTPWGWMTYYAWLDVYIWEPVDARGREYPIPLGERVPLPPASTPHGGAGASTGK